MITIKDILELNNLKYIDKNLSWGAKLSNYKDELKKYQDYIIYGIELEQDIKPPKNYIEIDHHNQNLYKLSSIEQVAKILGIELNRYQELVGANDSGYIKGMKKICATDDEIQTIRAKDRAAQGVTKKDEELAIQSLQKNNSNKIYSYTPHFSTISDRVFDKHDNYIVYTDTKVVFYGYDIKNIIKYLEQNSIRQNSYYYGGGEFGFVGIKDNILNKTQIENLIQGFKMDKKEETIYSYHTFMLPFSFDKKDKKEIIKSYKKKEYNIGYNQEAYFHDFFKNSLFHNTDYYINDIYNNSELIMKKSQEYHLVLESVNLRLFDTNIGILTFNIKNTKYYNIKSILEINDYFRRLYPEYLDYENKKSGLVADYIKLGDIVENFEFNEKLTKPTISKIIQEFLPIDKVKPSIDDRMFVISFYKNNKFTNNLKQDFIKNDRWYEYVFVDGYGKTVQSNDMQKELIQKATYSRWQDCDTMYGISKYSFVCAANSDFPLPHMQTIYYNIFSLLLVIRATLLKFSSEVSDIAKNIDSKNTADDVNDLYKRYIQFVNSFYFREITAKDQGLELYEKAMDILNIQRDIKDLDSEIEELHKYVEISNNKKETEQMNNLNKLGYIFLPGTFIAGFFGMNTFSGLDNMGGFLFSVIVIIYSTLHVTKVHDIKIKDFFIKDKNEH
jgi:hypothetical protein